MANVIKGLLPSGKAPSVLRQEIIELVAEHAPEPEPITTEAVAKALGYSLVVSETAPEPTAHGVPVIWFDTRNPATWTPTPPIIDDTAKTVTIPADEGATYTLNGEEKTAGIYPFKPDKAPVAITVVARAKSGYNLTAPTKWTGFITAGWRVLGTDTLTTGTWAPARSPFGTPYAETKGTPEITATGLSTTAHGATAEAILTFSDRSTAMRLSLDYDVSTSVAGSKPYVVLGVGYKSVHYADTTNVRVGITYAKAGVGAVTASGIGKDTFTITPTEVPIPLTGTLTAEAVGQDLKLYVGGTLVATGQLPGAANGMRALFSLVNNRATARNFKVEVQ